MPSADRRNARGSGQIPTSPLHADLLPRCPALSPMGQQHLSLPPEAPRVPVRGLPFPTRVPTPPTRTGSSSLPFAGAGHRGERLGTSRVGVVRAAIADPSVLRLLVARPVTSRRVHVPVAFARNRRPAASQGPEPRQGRGERSRAFWRPHSERPSTEPEPGSVCPSEGHVSGGFGGPATPGFPRGPLALRPSLTAGLPFRPI